MVKWHISLLAGSLRARSQKVNVFLEMYWAIILGDSSPRAQAAKKLKHATALHQSAARMSSQMSKARPVPSGSLSILFRVMAIESLTSGSAKAIEPPIPGWPNEVLLDKRKEVDEC